METFTSEPSAAGDADARPERRSPAAAVTIKDVARECGLSVATVSRALNDHSNVLAETKAIVLEAAARLKFIPSGAARAMISRRTDTVGALLPDLHGEYFSELIRGIDLAARSRGLHLLLSSSHGDAKEAAAALRAMNGRVDGLLVMSPHVNADFLSGNVPESLPVVLMNSRADPDAHSTYEVDNHGGAYAMVRHLVDQGHRRVVFIAGPESNYEAQERESAYLEAMRALLPGTAPEVLPGDFSQEAGFRAGIRLAGMAERPTAVFACNDLMAIGCMSALSEAGVSVPADVAVCGFDDIPISRYVTPSLTTVRARITELGGLALERLAVEIEDPQAVRAQHLTLTAELVMRDSTAARRPPSIRKNRRQP